MAGTKITLEQMIEKCEKLTYSHFTGDVFEFTTLVGQYSKNFFQESFDRQSFNGSKWKPRESRWGKRFTHPILYDTGTLEGSIRNIPQSTPGYNIENTSETIGYPSEKSKRRKDGKFVYKKYLADYLIKTNEVSRAIRGKRGFSPKSKGYAAIHNTDPRISPYTVNQYSSRKPVQRQFIGFSQELDDYVNNNLIKNVLLRSLPV